MITAAMAAGLKMCRPRMANRYLEALAMTATRARIPRPCGSTVGKNRNSNRNAVMFDDSACGFTRKMSANSRLER